MAVVDLGAEHLAALHHMVAERGLSRLVALGVTGPAYIRAGFIGLAHVELARDLYQPIPGGAAAYIFPAAQEGKVIDLVAALVDEPQRWATRLGIAFALGADAIAEHLMFPRSSGPLELHATALAWLRNGCAGAFIVRPEDTWHELRDIEAVTVADLDHGRSVARMLTPPPWPRPRVLVRRPSTRKCAAAPGPRRLEAVP